MTTQEPKEDWENRLREILDDCFPKLNEDDVTKPSPNNRSAALVMYAETVMLVRRLLEAEREKTKETKECKCPEDTTVCEMPYRDPMFPPNLTCQNYPHPRKCSGIGHAKDCPQNPPRRGGRKIGKKNSNKSLKVTR